MMVKYRTATNSSRRTFFKSTVVGVSAGVLGIRSADVGAYDSYGTVNPPATTPFVEPLPVAAPKQALSVINPPATEFSQTNEAGRDAHQRWATFPPQKF